MLKSENCFPCKEVFEEEMTLAGVIPAALFLCGFVYSTGNALCFGALGERRPSVLKHSLRNVDCNNVFPLNESA